MAGLDALTARMRRYYAATWLPHAATVARPSGAGRTAGFTPLALGVPCRWVAAAPADWALDIGALESRTHYEVKFPAGQDVAPHDRLTRTDAGGAGLVADVRGVKPAGAYGPTRRALVVVVERA